MDDIQLYNTRTRSLQAFSPLDSKNVRVYSCGPTVYDYVHIGNLSAFITADILRRTLVDKYRNVKQVMNFTDVDDKTIARSSENHPELQPMEALRELTEYYGQEFLSDMKTIGNDIAAIDFIKAADEPTIEGMRQLITRLHRTGFAYVADDGVYFDITAYKESGKTYGQLVELSESNTSASRIQNDEYDKDSVHDFALWKIKKSGEPAWEFSIDGRQLDGRPGWHLSVRL